MLRDKNVSLLDEISSCTLLKASGPTSYSYVLSQTLKKTQYHVNKSPLGIQIWCGLLLLASFPKTSTCKSNCSKRQLMSLKLCNSSLRNGGGSSKCLKATKYDCYLSLPPLTAQQALGLGLWPLFHIMWFYRSACLCSLLIERGFWGLCYELKRW